MALHQCLVRRQIFSAIGPETMPTGRTD